MDTMDTMDRMDAMDAMDYDFESDPLDILAHAATIVETVI